jgi:segregation and condensation protein B
MNSGSNAHTDEPVPQRLPGVDSGREWSAAELAALVEAFLLVAPEPPSVAELADGAGTTPEAIGAALDRLGERRDRGWMVQRHGDRIHLATAPRFAPVLRRFLGLEREARLSSAALEVLAIVAYRQPVTRIEIEAVRGVDCSGVLATLHARGLVEAVSRRSTVGNPIQYGTSVEFLRHFGLSSLDDLPAIGSIDGEDGFQLLQAMSSAGDDDGPPDDVVLSETVGR